MLSPPGRRILAANGTAIGSAISTLVSCSRISIAPTSCLATFPLRQEHRQQPFRIGVLFAADVETEPRGAARQTGPTRPLDGLCARNSRAARFPMLGFLPRIDDDLGRRKPR